MTTATQTLTLKTAIGSYGHTNAIKSGAITPKGVRFDQVEVAPIINAFRRMCRTLEFDACEMAITTYLCARAEGKPFTALPIFLVRAFHHGTTMYNVKSGVTKPKDLEGKKVGVRAWTVTSGVWAKSILAKEYGVDLEKVNWIIVDEEHVAEYKTPGNVTSMPGANLADMLAKNEIAAAIGVGNVDSPDVKPLIDNAGAAQADWFKRTGIFPINHTFVVQNKFLEANPTLGKDLFDAFKEAKDKYVATVATSTAEEDAAAKRNQALVGDPFPYGLGVPANAKAVDGILEAAQQQHIIPAAGWTAEQIFAKGAMGW